MRPKIKNNIRYSGRYQSNSYSFCHKQSSDFTAQLLFHYQKVPIKAALGGLMANTEHAPPPPFFKESLRLWFWCKKKVFFFRKLSCKLCKSVVKCDHHHQCCFNMEVITPPPPLLSSPPPPSTPPCSWGWIWLKRAQNIYKILSVSLASPRRLDLWRACGSSLEPPLLSASCSVMCCVINLYPPPKKRNHVF